MTVSSQLDNEAKQIRKTNPRIAIYTHDTFGLGHVRRCMHIIRQISSDYPEAAMLLITGSPALHYLKNLPKNVDIVKIPTIVQTDVQGSLPPHLPLPVSELVSIRERIIKETVLSFKPDVFLVDNFPLGIRSELKPVLEALQETETKTIVGFRDIFNGAEIVRAEWKKKGMYDIFDKYYDKVLIYGVQEIYDPIVEYEIPPHVAKKVHFCGYLTATDIVPDQKVEIRSKYAGEGPFILATGGGGGDAHPLLCALIDAAAFIPNCRVLIFSGPLMGSADRQSLEERVVGCPQVTLLDYVQDLRPYLKAADLLVSMCGYNIAAEIVHHGTKAIVAPRTWRPGEHTKRAKSTEENEQYLRSKVLAKYGCLNFLDPEDLVPERLAKKIISTLDDKKLGESPLNLSVKGLENAVKHIYELV